MIKHPQRIIIVGAGIGGLSAAIRLAVQGHAVHMLERQPQIGGKLNQMAMHGFTFDTGPSLITMPFVLEELFQSAQRRLEDYVTLMPLDTAGRYFFRDGLTLNAWRDHDRLVEEFSRFNAQDGTALQHFITYVERIYAAVNPLLSRRLGSRLHVIKTFARYIFRGHAKQANNASTVPAVLAPSSRNPFVRFKAVLAALSPMTLDECVQNFFHDEHLHRFFNRYATYTGSSPYQIGSVYSTLPYLELACGNWYVCGGMYTLVQALGKLAQELGVCIETDCNVQRILVEHGTVRGVVLDDGRVLRSDVVIANSDVITTHRELLSPFVVSRRQLRRLKKLEPSCSGFVLLLGVDKQYPQLAHSNIFFSNDSPAEFDDLFTRHIPLLNPTISLCASSRTDATQAPPGHENLVVQVNAPSLTEKSNWHRDAAPYRDHILELLASYPQAGLEDIREHIVCEAMITPEDFRRLYGASAGSIYGLSSNRRIAPFSRPVNRSPRIRNLYFVGGSTHPGGGVPLVTLSGKIVADMIGENITK